MSSIYSSKGFYLFHDEDGHLATLCEADMESPTWDNTREDETFTWTEIGNDSRDTPEHCEVCNVLISCPLTDEGLEYVADAIREQLSRYGYINDDDPLYAWHKEYGAEIEREYQRERNVEYSSLSGNEESEFLEHYLETLLWTGSITWWSNTQEYNGEPIDADSILDNYADVSDLTEEIVSACKADCKDFLEKWEEYHFYFEGADSLSIGQLAHDFSLTRNHHGAGFWDRGLGELGEWLTKLSDLYEGQSLYGSVQVSDPENYLETVIPETLSLYLDS